MGCLLGALIAVAAFASYDVGTLDWWAAMIAANIWSAADYARRRP